MKKPGAVEPKQTEADRMGVRREKIKNKKRRLAKRKAITYNCLLVLGRCCMMVQAKDGCFDGVSGRFEVTVTLLYLLVAM